MQQAFSTDTIGLLCKTLSRSCFTVIHHVQTFRFRMRQVNIVGTSPPSQPSRKIQTLPAPPDMAPANVTLRTASETSLWLRWMVSIVPNHLVILCLFRSQKALAPFDPSFDIFFLHAQPLPEWEYNGNAEQVGYRVQYYRVGSQGRGLTHAITDRLEREFTIEDLEEWTEYDVRVQAVNGIGTGPWSHPVRGRTRESGESSYICSNTQKDCFFSC